MQIDEKTLGFAVGLIGVVVGWFVAIFMGGRNAQRVINDINMLKQSSDAHDKLIEQIQQEIRQNNSQFNMFKQELAHTKELIQIKLNGFEKMLEQEIHESNAWKKRFHETLEGMHINYQKDLDSLRRGKE